MTAVVADNLIRLDFGWCVKTSPDLLALCSVFVENARSDSGWSVCNRPRVVDCFRSVQRYTCRFLACGVSTPEYRFERLHDAKPLFTNKKDKEGGQAWFYGLREVFVEEYRRSKRWSDAIERQRRKEREGSGIVWENQ